MCSFTAVRQITTMCSTNANKINNSLHTWPMHFLSESCPVNIQLGRDHTAVSITVNSQLAAVTTTHASTNYFLVTQHSTC